MSLFNWLTRKTSASDEEESLDLSHADATQPLFGTSLPKQRPSGSVSGAASHRRTERLERRELLYGVVRESMTQSGVLSSKYKFKVLSLDSKGREYLIMMDLPKDGAVESDRFTKIEGLIARNAKNLHGILVTAVYWRVVEPVAATTAGLNPPPIKEVAVHTSTAATLNKPAVEQVEKVAQMGNPRHRFEPINADEVEAFKKALASAPVANTPKPVGEIVKSGRRNPAPMPHFADTELDDSHSPLSGTQYGDLR